MNADKLTESKLDKCVICQGTGLVAHQISTAYTPCSYCQGNGWTLNFSGWAVLDGKPFEVTTPTPLGSQLQPALFASAELATQFASS
jgi:hypothetical protein